MARRSRETMFAKTLPLLDRAARQTDLEPSLAQLSVHTPHGFAHRCREIVATMPGHAAHRELDLLTNEVLAGLGFGAGIEIFEAAVQGWHRDGLPYPLPEAEPLRVSASPREPIAAGEAGR